MVRILSSTRVSRRLRECRSALKEALMMMYFTSDVAQGPTELVGISGDGVPAGEIEPNAPL